MAHVQLVGIIYNQYDYCKEYAKYSIYTRLSFSLFSYFIIKYRK